MYKIVKKEQLSEVVWLMEIEAANVAEHCEPGQFVIVRTSEEGERVPLTICDYDRDAKTVTIAFQPLGVATHKLLTYEAGDSIADIVGPLGVPSEFIHEDLEELKKKRILFVAGGVGTAPVYPQVKWLHNHGVEADVIIGARTKSLLFFEDKMKEVAANLYITTDDGSYGREGVVTKVIEDLVENQGVKYDCCVSIGPMIMMKFCTLTTKKYNIPTIVSMNPIMVDGTGMCGACRLTLHDEVNGDQVKFACVDGPEFDGFKIDWNECMKRMQMYKTEEGRAKLKYEEGATHHGGCGNCGGDK